MPTPDDLAEVIALCREEVAYSIEQCDQHTMVDNRHLTALLDAAEAGILRNKRLLDLSRSLSAAAQNDHMVDRHFTKAGVLLNNTAERLLGIVGGDPKNPTIYDACFALKEKP